MYSYRHRRGDRRPQQHAERVPSVDAAYPNARDLFYDITNMHYNFIFHEVSYNFMFVQASSWWRPPAKHARRVSFDAQWIHNQRSDGEALVAPRAVTVSD